jgi:hypothetical protein
MGRAGAAEREFGVASVGDTGAGLCAAREGGPAGPRRGRAREMKPHQQKARRIASKRAQLLAKDAALAPRQSQLATAPSLAREGRDAGVVCRAVIAALRVHITPLAVSFAPAIATARGSADGYPRIAAANSRHPPACDSARPVGLPTPALEPVATQQAAMQRPKLARGGDEEELLRMQARAAARIAAGCCCCPAVPPPGAP